MENHLLADKDLNLWALLRLTEGAIFKARERELAQYGITVEQAAVCFYVLIIGNNATPAELSRWMLREPHTISGIIDRMERKGMVRKVKDLDRKNQIRVVLTEKGQQAYDQSTNREAIHNIISSLSEEKRKQLRSCLNTLRDKALKELGIFNKPPFPPLE